MSLCTHPRSQIYSDGEGRTRCACCGDVYEGEIHTGAWRPSRDSVDPPFVYTDPIEHARQHLGLGGTTISPLEECTVSCPFHPNVNLPSDQRIVACTFGLAVMAAGYEQSAAMKEEPFMYRVVHLAADSSSRFSAAITVLAETKPVQ